MAANSGELLLAKSPKRPKANEDAVALDPDSSASGAFPIVGIGMSAGGLEVATAFLNAMPADSGLGFVIVQHLDPTRESMLVKLLSRETAMPVVAVEEGMRVEPNRVHIIVPAKTLLIRDGIFRLVEPEEKRGFRHPIDKFFSALAEDRKTKAIAIILSGAGSNGTAGIQDIKQYGGLCIAQDPPTAKFDSMPRHAIASGSVDYVLAPEAMPAALLRYIQHSYIADPTPQISEGSQKEDPERNLDDLLELLILKGKHDFREYKRNTLSRRVHRRMSLAHIEKLGDYLAFLQSDTREVGELTKDLMINVTAFFRDPEAWKALERDVIAPLVEEAEPGQTLRVWVPACSTGEEAYTIAILLAERTQASDKDLGIKIFATDPADHNLASARKGLFPGSMVESLSPERLARFFKIGEDGYYKIAPSIRETILFAPQNLLSDAPYSRMDLISCRNLLIYMEPDAQDKILTLAHFALREKGYLFLGNAETVGRLDHLFEMVSKRWRIYRRVGRARPSVMDFSKWPSRQESIFTPRQATSIADVAARTLADRFAPASVLIDGSFRALHFHGPTDQFLTQPSGAPTLDILTLAREGLRMTLHSAVQKAIEDKKSVTMVTRFEQGKAGNTVTITASPVDGDLILVSFANPENMDATVAPAPPPQAETPSRNFEEELFAARAEMRGTVEQYETTNEELTAANEEITSVNEELQSTNEELESSKEELQSLNEELSTINSELDRKIAALDRASDDLQNLLLGNKVATLFLDTQLRLKYFTPAIQSLFDLIDEDVGRPIAAFAQKFPDIGLVEKAQAAIDRLETLEQEVRADDGHNYMLRVFPYRTRDDRIAGAVATFIDIDDLKVTQNEMAVARDFAEAIVETVGRPLLVLDGSLKVVSANNAFYQMFEMRRADAEGKPFFELERGQWDVPRLRDLLEHLLPDKDEVLEFEVNHDFPKLGERDIMINARRIPGSGGRPDLILLAKEDITHRRNAERHQELMISELSHRVKNTLAVVQSIASQTKRGSTTLEQFSESFSGRLQALASANDLVIAGNWKAVDLRHLLDRAIRPFSESGQFVINDGPPVELRPQPSLTVAMILHELATNAVKYGALSDKSGSTAICWRIETKRNVELLCLDWKESGGPPVVAPDRQGQGSRFIERSVSYELKGKVKLDYAATGLEFLAEIPLTDIIVPSESSNGTGEPQ